MINDNIRIPGERIMGMRLRLQNGQFIMLIGPAVGVKKILDSPIVEFNVGKEFPLPDGVTFEHLLINLPGVARG